MLKRVNFLVHNKLSVRKVGILDICAFLDFIAQFKKCHTPHPHHPSESVNYWPFFAKGGHIQTHTHIFFPTVVLATEC